MPNDYDIPLKTSTIRGLSTAWLDNGKLGQPVLFLCHGFPDDAFSWKQQFRFFNEKFHIIAPFVRGCEPTAASDSVSRYSSQAILLDHIAILEASGVSPSTKITVFGHDLGAVHALNLARSLGKRIQRVVIINGGDIGMFARRLKQPAQVAKSWYMGLMQIPVVPELMIKFAPSSCAWLAGEIGGLDASHRRIAGFERRTLGPLNQYRAFARELPENMKSRESRIESPILVLFGRDDGFLEMPTREEWDAIGLDVTIRIIPGGHWIHIESADLINEIIGEFALKIGDILGSKTQDSKREVSKIRGLRAAGSTHE